MNTSASMYACTLCLMVSVGTLTKADMTAPADADAKCVTALGRPFASSLSLHHSYVVKYNMAVGIVPKTAPVRPLYMSFGPCKPQQHAQRQLGAIVYSSDSSWLCCSITLECLSCLMLHRLNATISW